jgi:hypothetical protein
VETFRSGNASLRQILRGLFYVAYCHGTLARRNGVGRPARWLYDRFQTLVGGLPFPERKGQIPIGEATPRCDLNLRQGDMVRVKSYQEILATLDTAGSNRGLSFAAELVPDCGKIYRVKTRLEKFIDERTGKMRKPRTPAVILEGAYCRSLYSGERILCPRSIYAWWREIWLERVPEGATAHHVTETKRRSQDARWPETSSMPEAISMKEGRTSLAGATRSLAGTTERDEHGAAATIDFGMSPRGETHQSRSSNEQWARH